MEQKYGLHLRRAVHQRKKLLADRLGIDQTEDIPRAAAGKHELRVVAGSVRERDAGNLALLGSDFGNARIGVDFPAVLADEVRQEIRQHAAAAVDAGIARLLRAGR